MLANIRFLISWVKCSSEEQQVLVSVAPQQAKNTPGSDFLVNRPLQNYVQVLEFPQLPGAER